MASQVVLSTSPEVIKKETAPKIQYNISTEEMDAMFQKASLQWTLRSIGALEEILAKFKLSTIPKSEKPVVASIFKK